MSSLLSYLLWWRLHWKHVSAYGIQLVVHRIQQNDQNTNWLFSSLCNLWSAIIFHTHCGSDKTCVCYLPAAKHIKLETSEQSGAFKLKNKEDLKENEKPETQLQVNAYVMLRLIGCANRQLFASLNTFIISRVKYVNTCSHLDSLTPIETTETINAALRFQLYAVLCIIPIILMSNYSFLKKKATNTEKIRV